MALNGRRLESERIAAATQHYRGLCIRARAGWLVGAHQGGRPTAVLIHSHSESSEVWTGTGGTVSGDDRFAMW